MRQNNYQALIEELLPIIRLAGNAVMAVYEAGDVEVRQKGNSSLVTEADLAAHRILTEYLTPLLPDCPVVSEEDEASQTQRIHAGRIWLIDPLDGTKEFIARNGEFTVNIALIEDGCSVLGVVYAPAIDALYWGGAGMGAFRSIGSQKAVIQVGNIDTGCCRVVASKSHLNAETQSFINKLGAVSLVRAGSSLKFCRVAEGMADIYPRLAPTCEWDTAAAQAVLEGAGGVVLDLQGRPLRYSKPEVLNPSFIATRNAALIPV